MKSVFIISILLNIMCCSYAQRKESVKIPNSLQQKVDLLFPNHDQAEWAKRCTKYEANFLYKNHNISMTFNKKGDLLKAINEIDYGQLPNPVKEEIAKNYSDYKLYFFLENVNKGKIDYDVEIMKGKNFYILNYNGNGEMLNKYIVTKNDISTLTPSL